MVHGKFDFYLNGGGKLEPEVHVVPDPWSSSRGKCRFCKRLAPERGLHKLCSFCEGMYGKFLLGVNEPDTKNWNICSWVWAFGPQIRRLL